MLRPTIGRSDGALGAAAPSVGSMGAGPLPFQITQRRFPQPSYSDHIPFIGLLSMEVGMMFCRRLRRMGDSHDRRLVPRVESDSENSRPQGGKKLATGRAMAMIGPSIPRSA